MRKVSVTTMKKLTITFEFPDHFTHDEVENAIYGYMCDADKELKESVSYTVRERAQV